MRRVLLLLLGGAGLALSALAQQGTEPVPPGGETDPLAAGTETAAEASPEAATEPVEDPAEEPEPKIDDVYYQDVDDKDFRPSEDIPADQSIPFPSDI